MRLVSFGAPGEEQAGAIVEGSIVPLGELGFDGTVRALLASGRLAELSARAATCGPGGIALDSVRLGPPVVDPGKIICVGLNYHGHAAEQKAPLPERPLLFAKAPTALTGCADAIVIPDPACGPDYEVELVAVIGRRGRNIGESQAMRHVAGFMVGNDVSARRWQKQDGQWFRAKSSDTFMPCGPWLTTREEVGDHRGLRLTTTIAGAVLQDALASDLIFDLPAIIAYASRSMTLEPGDLISTGTPAGVGCYRDPIRFLQPGEVVECAIASASCDLGRLANPVAGPTATPAGS